MKKNQKESDESAIQRGNWSMHLSKIFENQTLEAGRMVTVDMPYSPRKIYKVLGYDFAFFRGEYTGCAFGYGNVEHHFEFYRHSMGGGEEVLILADMRRIEIFSGELPTLEESDLKKKNYISFLCQARLPPEHPGYLTMACYRPKGHKEEQHMFASMPPNVSWPKVPPRRNIETNRRLQERRARKRPHQE